MGNFKPNFAGKNFISANAITVIDENGTNLGVMATGAAKSLAYSRGMSLKPVAGKIDTYEFKKWVPKQNGRDEYRHAQSERDQERAQYEITADTVRLTDETGASVGVISTAEARKMAEERGVDLIAINNNINPPIGRLGDLNKYIYDQKKSLKERDKKNRAAAKATEEKEIKYTSDTTASSLNDRQRMLAQADDFMKEGHPVRLTIKFRGREMDHAPEAMERIKTDIEHAFVNGAIGKIVQSSNTFTIFCTPKKRK